MNLPDTEIAGRDQFDLSAGKSGLSVFRPCGYRNLHKALEDFKRTQVSYLMLDDKNIKRCGYLRNVYDPRWSRHFILLRTFKSKASDGWIIKDMDIFKIVY